MSATLQAPPLQPKQSQEQLKKSPTSTQNPTTVTSPPNKIKIDPKPTSQQQPKKVTNHKPTV